MDWNTLISAKRFGLEEFHKERHENRSEFQRDYDRLIFSAPFRRLQNKTQVFPLPGSIFVHNRLTHSLEVSCVGHPCPPPRIAKLLSAGNRFHCFRRVPGSRFGQSAVRAFRRTRHLHVLFGRKGIGIEREAARRGATHPGAMGRPDTL